MSQADSSAQLVRADVAAFNRGDLEVLRALFAPDAHIQGVLGAGLIDMVVGMWRSLIEGLGIHDHRGSDCGWRAGRGSIYRARRIAGCAAMGKSYQLVAMEWFVVRDGLIQRRWAARDSACQARQIGLPMV